LYFVGIASAFSLGPVMRFVFGAKHAAAILTAHLRAAARTVLRTIAGQERRGTRTAGPIACPTGGAPPVDLKAVTTARIWTRGSGGAQDVDIDHEEARGKM
jgi:hypothetical protein